MGTMNAPLTPLTHRALNLDKLDLDTALKEAKALAQKQIAERCKMDLFYLCKYILGPEDNLMNERTHGALCAFTQSILPIPLEMKQNIMASHHITPAESQLAKPAESTRESAATIADDYDPAKKMLLLMMPRNTFKSSIVTIGFTLQYFLHDPNARVLIDSETYSKAKNFLAEIKGHLEGNQKYRDVFFTIHGCYPDDNKRSTSVRWTDAQMDLACRTKQRKEASITASGIDRSINGLHFDLIIGDDLHSEKNTTNKEQIEQVIDHWKLSLSLLEPNKYMIVIGTRWDYNDLYQYLLDEERDRFNVMIRQARFPDGTLLFPELLDDAFLTNQRKTQGSYIFSCQYMNDPIDDESATFKREYFQYKDWEAVKGKPINWYLCVDPSQDGPMSDFAAFVEVGMDYMGELVVGDCYRMKLRHGEIVNFIFDLHNRKHYRAIAVETVAGQKSLSYMLGDEQKSRRQWLPLKDINSRVKSKEDRILGLSPYYEFRRVWHLNDGKGLPDLEDELLHFPKGKHDDVIDALATVLEVATVPRAPTEERLERRKKRIIGDKPRSPLMGT